MKLASSMYYYRAGRAAADKIAVQCETARFVSDDGRASLISSRLSRVSQSQGGDPPDARKRPTGADRRQ
jgi:hypothetical protein